MKIMTLRAPEEMQKQLTISARRKGLTRNALILQILWRWLKDVDK